MMKKAVLALAALCVLQFAAVKGEGDVLSLTSATYEDTVGDGKVYFIKYFAPWCGHCKRLAPTWAELAAAYKDSESIAIAHVDCTVDRDICTKAEISGYPTLKVVHKGETYKAYRGARDLSSLKAFVEDAAKDLLTESS